MDSYMMCFTLILVFLAILLPSSRKLLYPITRTQSFPPTRIPGPVGLPIVGNWFQLGTRPQQKLCKWAKKYGDLFKIRLGQQDWIFVNSPQAVKEIFERHASATASRAPLPVVSGLVSGGKRLFLMPRDSTLRYLRTIMQSQFAPSRLQAFEDAQEFEARLLVHRLLRDNHDGSRLFAHCQAYTLGTMLRVTYGWGVETAQRHAREAMSTKDPTFDLARTLDDLMQDFSEITLSRPYLADVFPFFNHLPWFLQWWRRSAFTRLLLQRMLWNGFWSALVHRVDVGSSPECFGRILLNSHYKKSSIQDIDSEQWAFLCGTVIEAGSGSTFATLVMALRLLANNPDIQERARYELEQAQCKGHPTGSHSRSPRLADKSKCPYTRAIVQETLRIIPSTAIGIQHYTTEPIEYKGYTIPANSIVVINSWALFRGDSTDCGSASFRPERWLDKAEDSSDKQSMDSVLCKNAEGNPSENSSHRLHGETMRQQQRYVWGAGHRICPGRHLAESTLWLALAKIIWACKIEPVKGWKSKDLELNDDAFETGRIMVPKPFPLRFVPREERLERTILKEVEEMRG